MPKELAEKMYEKAIRIISGSNGTLVEAEDRVGVEMCRKIKKAVMYRYAYEESREFAKYDNMMRAKPK